MKKQIDNISTAEQQKEVFREKADHYLAKRKSDRFEGNA